MTTQELLTTCRQANIVLQADGDRLKFDAPSGALTADLRAALQERKADVLAVLWRLEGMRQHRDPVPTAKSPTDAPGGPGRCFSCGDRHDHPQAYGRCVLCAITAELFYAERRLETPDPTTADQMQVPA